MFFDTYGSPMNLSLTVATDCFRKYNNGETWTTNISTRTHRILLLLERPMGYFQVGPSVFADLGNELLGGRGASYGTVFERRFMATFGCNTILCALNWNVELSG